MSTKADQCKAAIGMETYPRPAVAWGTVAILSGLYMFSFIDRQILVLLIEPIKVDLSLTDTGVSFLTGLAFAAMYAILGVPMGRAADLWSRTRVIIIGVSIWSTLTIMCGFARNFVELFVARMGVGLGEAALTPAGYAVVSDLFPPARLARGMSAFVVGGVLGSGVSLLAGGIVIRFATQIGTVSVPVFGDLRVWQTVLIVVGVLSLLMVVPLLFAPEPTRHRSEGLAMGVRGKDSFAHVLSYMWLNRRFFARYIFGMTAISLYFYGSSAWFPTYFIRVHGWDAGSIGMRLGVLSIPCSLFGALLAGWSSDHLSRRGMRVAPLRILVVAALLSLPLPATIVVSDNMWLQLSLMGASYFLFGAVIVLAPIAIQLATSTHMRAQVSAIYLLIANIIAIGFGPTGIALITDFGFGNELALGNSIAIVGAVCFALGAGLIATSIPPFRALTSGIREAGSGSLCSND